MGGGTYSNAVYESNNVARSATYHSSVLRHTDDISRGRVSARVHQRLHPDGLRVRESRDSAEHPESLAIMIWADVTGSMGRIPAVIRQKLPHLMGLLTERGYAAHPQVLFGAVGDATCDRGPVQVGQFESNNELHEDLDAIWAEGGGGGQDTESYELAYYVAARHTSIDCHEKRGRKGYLFTIGDERPYGYVEPEQVKAIFGAGLQSRIATRQIVDEAQAKYHCFHLIAAAGSRGGERSVRTRWRELLGDNAIVVEDMEYVAETIAVIVGMTEGNIDLDTGAAHLVEFGIEPRVAAAIRASVVPVAARAIALRA